MGTNVGSAMQRHFIPVFQYRIMREWYKLSPQLQSWLLVDAGKLHPDINMDTLSSEDALALGKLFEFVGKSAESTGYKSFMDNWTAAHKAIINAVEQDALSWLHTNSTASSRNLCMSAPRDIQQWASEYATTFMDGSDETYFECMVGIGADAVRELSDLYTDSGDSVHRNAAESILSDSLCISLLRIIQRYRDDLFTDNVEYPLSEGVGDVVFKKDDAGDVRAYRITDRRDDVDPYVYCVMTLTDVHGVESKVAVRKDGDYYRDRVGFLSHIFFSDRPDVKESIMVDESDPSGAYAINVQGGRSRKKDASQRDQYTITHGFFNNIQYANDCITLMRDYRDRVQFGFPSSIQLVDFEQWERCMNRYLPALDTVTLKQMGIPNSTSMANDPKLLRKAIDLSEQLLSVVVPMKFSSHPAMRSSLEWANTINDIRSEMKKSLQIMSITRVVRAYHSGLSTLPASQDESNSSDVVRSRPKRV